ncbi:predicted protein [Nematostella vectensis]|uniref:FIST domain-containing protein n=1 Tax=Nematostella vectensis TaxID=45351 RepID=A7RLL5_NEMVE|nr:predicted protein [Nematostella vectensis]|eukprot:XP_001639689.1 predicted protein [Nematostella vectensis]
MATKLNNKINAGYCLSEMADIVEIILTLRQLRRKRKKCYITVLPLTLLKKSLDQIVDFLQNVVLTEAQALLLMSCGQTSCFESLKKVLTGIKQSVPPKCAITGGTFNFVLGTKHLPCDPGIGSNFRDELFGNNPMQPQTTSRISSNLGMILIPRTPDVQVSDFYVPLRNKYKGLEGLGSFLPDMDLPVRLVLVFIHPLSLGKLTKFAVTCKSKYGNEVVLAGCYSQDFVFFKNMATHHEIAGLVVSGNIKAATVVIPYGRDNEDFIGNVITTSERILGTNFTLALANTFALMFFPNLTFMQEVSLLTIIRDKFPNVPFLCSQGPAAYGCDTVKLEAEGRVAGGRDYLQRDAGVIVFMSIL